MSLRGFLKGCGIFAGLAVLGFIILVGIGGYFVYRGVQKFAENPGYVPVAGAQCAYDRKAGDAALAVALPGTMELGYPTDIYDKLYVRTYVRDGLYDYLDTLLTVYADSVRRDFRLENRMFGLYYAFYVADTTLKPFLDTWVSERPQSANARLVRAAWLTATGIDARGTRFVSETADSSMSSLQYYLDKAEEDIKAAYAIDSCSLVTYDLLMRASAHRGNMFLSAKLLEQALKIQPLTFWLRARNMYNLVPRWGGSYRAMDKFALEADSLIPRNPRLRALHGFGVWDRADRSEAAHDTIKAIAQYDSALTYGDYWQFRLDRGQFMWRLDNNQSALDDLEHANNQHPQYARTLYYLARTSYDIGRSTPAERDQRFHDAFRYIDMAIALDPGDADAQKSRDFYLKNIPRYAPAPPPGD